MENVPFEVKDSNPVSHDGVPRANDLDGLSAGCSLAITVRHSALKYLTAKL